MLRLFLRKKEAVNRRPKKCFWKIWTTNKSIGLLLALFYLNDLVISELHSQSRGPESKITGWLQGWLGLSFHLS